MRRTEHQPFESLEQPGVSLAVVFAGIVAALNVASAIATLVAA